MRDDFPRDEEPVGDGREVRREVGKLAAALERLALVHVSVVMAMRGVHRRAVGIRSMPLAGRAITGHVAPLVAAV